MVTPTALVYLALAAAMVFALVIVVFPSITRDRGGKVFAFFPLFILPLGVGFIGGYHHLETSKRTEFCLSCHTMSDHGRSLYLDDPTALPAQHFQNQRVPREQACYTCHRDYTMYGDIAAKWRGLNHVYVYYFGTVPEPAQIKLYNPYNNRECLYCHQGARTFEEGFSHNLEPQIMPAIKSNEMSCLSSGCHENSHEVATLSEKEFWQPGQASE